MVARILSLATLAVALLGSNLEAPHRRVRLICRPVTCCHSWQASRFQAIPSNSLPQQKVIRPSFYFPSVELAGSGPRIGSSIEAGRFSADDTVVWLHTGGLPGLFAYPAAMNRAAMTIARKAI